jgi:vacuolar-type H+-ATPase subunit I/STV1
MLKARYYDSIDTMPIYNYLKVVDDSKFSYLIKKKGIFGDVDKAFENIQRQLVARFGISESYSQQLELRREICELQCEVAITGDRFPETFIDIKQHELDQLNKVAGSTTEELKTILEKWLGFKLNLHDITVSEWFTYLKQFSSSQQTKAA